MGEPGNPKNVKVSGTIEARISPEFTKEYKAGQNQENARETHRFRVEIATLIVVFVYTLLAFWQGCSNQKSASAARDSADVAKTSLQATQRAYIDFSPHINPIETIARMPETGKQGLCCWQFEIPVVNSGGTPGADAQAHVEAIAEPKEIGPDFAFKDFKGGESLVIGSKDEITMVTKAIAASDAIHTYQGHGQIYIFGWITYHDVFPSTPLHKTKFCYRVAFWGDPSKMGVIPPTHYFLTPFHNCTDEQCDAQK